ncbi:MAG: class I SAM-dependent methyltransferase [Magnetovibrionaceae bacterium]
MSTPNPFETGGELYARARPTYPESLSGALGGLCEKHDLAVDIGCGTGQLTRLLARVFTRVIGVDPSEDQVANADGAGNSSSGSVSYVVGSASETTLPSAGADLITAAQAAHWFDLPAFYAEAKRIAAPGAVLALITYGVPRLGEPHAKLFDDFYWGPIHDHWPAERGPVEQAYGNLEFPFERLAIEAEPIRRDWSAEELLAYVRTWSASKRAIKAGQEGLIDGFAKELEAASQGSTVAVSWPVTVLAARL